MKEAAGMNPVIEENRAEGVCPVMGQNQAERPKFAMDEKQARNLNADALAYMGDAVYELWIRQEILRRGVSRADRLHRMSTAYVNAAAQAEVMRGLLGEMTEAETALIRRWRNHRYHSKAKHADPMTYKWATAFEAWIGYLYLTGQEQRLAWALRRAVEWMDAPHRKEEGSHVLGKKEAQEKSQK